MVLMVLARQSVFRSGFSLVFFVFIIIVLTIILYCAFRRVGLFFYVVFESRLIPTLFLIWGWGISQSRFTLGFIC
jgi:NADH:ubiquinone oxidoreductase subunit 4 (subunit M)